MIARIRQLALILCSLGLVGRVGAAPDPAPSRQRVVLVRPVILCDSDGTHPARHALPKALVDRVYTRAGLEFLYLDPIRWNHGKARRGEINLDTIVAEGRSNGMIAADPRVLTLLFVSAVDGKTRALGRGMQGGNVCFVNLGGPDEMTDPAMRAFVVAHEIGHCLGLRHAIDDPKVPDDERLYPLQPVPGSAGSYTPGPALDDDPFLDRWRARFPISTGYDDPREVMAYLHGVIFRSDLLKNGARPLNPEYRALLDEERQHLPELLGLAATE